MKEYLEMSQDDVQLVNAFCAWLHEIVESGEFEEKKKSLEEFRRKQEKKKYMK